MRTKLVLTVICLIVIICFSGCTEKKETNSSYNFQKKSQQPFVNDEQNKITPEEKIENKNEVVPSQVQQDHLITTEEIIKLSEFSDARYIYEKLETAYHDAHKKSKETEELTEQRLEGNISKEKFCEIAISNGNYLLKLKETLGKITFKSEVPLKESLDDLRREIMFLPVLNQLQQIKKYCDEESILILTTLRDSLSNENNDYDFRDSPVEAYSFVTTLSENQAVSVSLKNLNEKLRNRPYFGKVYNMGDTAIQSGLAVTLEKIEPDYLDWKTSYTKENNIWSPEEWKTIMSYKNKILMESNNVRTMLIEEMNEKFGVKVPKERRYIFMKVSLKDQENSDASRAYLSRFSNKQKAIMKIYDPISYNVLGYEVYDYVESGYGRGLFNKLNQSGRALMLLITLEDCGTTKEEIMAIERGEICSHTYIFKIDHFLLNTP